MKVSARQFQKAKMPDMLVKHEANRLNHAQKLIGSDRQMEKRGEIEKNKDGQEDEEQRRYGGESVKMGTKREGWCGRRVWVNVCGTFLELFE